jgi:FkbM family methyltransferase
VLRSWREVSYHPTETVRSIDAFARPLTSFIRTLSDRIGYPVVAKWRLEKLEHSAHLRQLFELLQIDCVLDVGANVGQFNEFLRLHVGYTGHVVSFEPVTEVFERLCEQARGDPSWTVHRLALGEQAGNAEITVMTERTLSSILPRNEESLRAMGYEKYLRETEVARIETIPVRRLDATFAEVVPGSARRVFLKSDTQGYDMCVVRGASGCLDKLPALQVELPVREVYRGAPDYLQSLAELNALGYEVTGLFPVQRDATLRVINLDAVLVRRDEIERLRERGRHAVGHAGRP